MPPLIDDLKDIVPIEKIDAAPAIQELSKTQEGATKILLTLWTIMLILWSGYIVIKTADSNNVQRDKDDTYWQPQITQQRQQITTLTDTILSLRVDAAILNEKMKKYDQKINSLKQ